MTKTIPIQRTDAIDQVMPLEGGRTAPFVLPKLRSGIFLAVYDTPARAVRYAADCSPDWPGDFVIHREGGPRQPDGPDRGHSRRRPGQRRLRLCYHGGQHVDRQRHPGGL